MTAALSLPSRGAFAFCPGRRVACAAAIRPPQPRFAASDVDSADATINLAATAGSTPSTTAATAKQQQPSFDDFDYATHWYPVSWARDVPLNEPIRVTLFDVDYVLAKTVQGGSKNDEEEVFYAMLDRCPHKKVALSEGRVTDGGYLQCSYHGASTCSGSHDVHQEMCI